uniref:Uncharacterized protein n=1 Tax=Anguilla anguilla TaxID=7936 RepID=A0A0E9XS56_ANGAN
MDLLSHGELKQISRKHLISAKLSGWTDTLLGRWK